MDNFLTACHAQTSCETRKIGMNFKKRREKIFFGGKLTFGAKIIIGGKTWRQEILKMYL